MVQGPRVEQQTTGHLPFALVDTPPCFVPRGADCADHVTQTSREPYSGDIIMVTTILQMSRLSREQWSDLPKTTQQSVLGLGCELKQADSKAVPPPTQLSCLWESQQPARNTCGGKPEPAYPDSNPGSATHMLRDPREVTSISEPLFSSVCPARVSWGWNTMVWEK